jgi:hypothetical protein
LRRLVFASGMSGCRAGGSRRLALVAGLPVGLFSAMRAFRPFSAWRSTAALLSAFLSALLAVSKRHGKTQRHRQRHGNK